MNLRIYIGPSKSPMIEIRLTSRNVAHWVTTAILALIGFILMAQR